MVIFYVSDYHIIPWVIRAYFTTGNRVINAFKTNWIKEVIPENSENLYLRFYSFRTTLGTKSVLVSILQRNRIQNIYLDR